MTKTWQELINEPQNPCVKAEAEVRYPEVETYGHWRTSKQLRLTCLEIDRLMTKLGMSQGFTELSRGYTGVCGKLQKELPSTEDVWHLLNTAIRARHASSEVQKVTGYVGQSPYKRGD